MTGDSFVERGMRQWRIVVTFVAILVGLGLYSFFTMQRQEFGDFTIRQGLVVGVMPGATSEEVEEQLTRPVEDYIFSFNEVDKKKTYSFSRNGQMVAFVELNGSIKGLEAPAFWAKLRHGLNELKSQQLPTGVLALVGNNDFGDTSAVIFTIVAEGRSPRDLQKYAEVLQSHLRRIDATAKLRTYGEQREVIRVSLFRDRLTRYAVRPATIWASLQGLGEVPAQARLDGDELERPIHLRRVLRSEASLADTILLSLPTGQYVRLKDVADIKREYGHDDAFVRFNGTPAMVLSIEMQSGNDITRFGDDVGRAVEAARRELPPNVTIARVADQPEVVRASVDHFLRDFGLAIGAVILATMLLLPLRVAAVAAITIPVSVAITLGALNALNVKLETVSLAGLIVVLGMIVDNAIVVIDDHVDKLDRGMDRWTAAWRSGKELTVPVLTATIAIVLSYVPLPLFNTGTARDFIGALPTTVGVALGVSLLVAILLVPVMNAVFIRRGLHQDAGKRSMLDRIQVRFDWLQDHTFRHPWLTVGAGLASFIAALAITAGLPQQMFPKLDRKQFAVEVYLPNGRSLKQTDAVLRRIEADLRADPRVANVTAFVGQSSPRFHMVYAPQMPARNYGQLIVNTVSERATEEVLRDKDEQYRGAFPEAWVRLKQLALQVGSAVEVRLSGRDIADLKAAAAKVESRARSVPGTTWVRNDYEEPLQTVDVVPDADECARLGVPPALLQTSLALGSQGYPIATIWEGDYPVRVLVEDQPGEFAGVEGLRQQYVSSLLAAASVPLEQVASIRPAWHEGAIARRNGGRTLTVHIDVARGVLASTVQARMEREVAALDLPGIRVGWGGDRELTEEVFPPFTRSMIVSIALIFLVVLIQFKHFNKAFVVMASMPLSLLGASLGLLVADYPFGITSFIGIVGLFGLVVRNGIILVSYAEQLQREHGMSAKDAALAAGKRRMRPIYLTAMAAAIGVLPMVIGRSTLWGPMGTVTCFGLLFAMVMTLFVLPVLYWLLVRGKDAQPGRPARTAAVAGIVLLMGLLPDAAGAQDQRLTLDECRGMALKNNAQIRESRLDIAAAEEASKAVHTKYFPQVSASMTGLLALDPLVKLEMTGGNLPVYDGNPAHLPSATEFAYFPSTSIALADRVSVFAVTAIQPLYTGGRVGNGNKLAGLGAQIARDKTALSERDVVAQTEEKYWQLVALQEKRRTLEAYEKLLAELDRQVGDAVQAGFLTGNDQLKVRLKQAEAGVDRQRLEGGMRLAARDLRRHIGLPPGDAIALVEVLLAPEDPTPLRAGAAGAVERRVETRLLASAVHAEELQLSLKRGEMLPTVSAGGAFYRLDVHGMAGATNALVFGQVSVPISGIWEVRHAVASQGQRVSIAKSKLSSTQELLALGIEKSWTDLQIAWEAVRVAGKAIDQAEVNVREVSDRYTNGMVTFSDLLEAQVLRQQSQDRRIDALVDYWLKRATYLRSIASDRRAP
jgi:multidrug efflux pump subunit AcrB/outer membrane protein TolC